MTNRLSGIIPPTVTPLDEGGRVDEDGIASLVEFQIANGVAGLFPLGSSGEAPYLSAGDRRRVIAATVGAASSRVPVLAGIIETGVDRAIDAGLDAVDTGADFVVLTTPFYASASPSEITRHFELVAARLPVPVIGYDIPSRTATKLPLAVTRDLAERGIIVGLKDSSSDFGPFRRLAATRPDRFSLLTGSELLVDAALYVGADGAVPGLANVDPAGFVEIFRAAQAEDWDAARAAQERQVSLFRIIDIGLGSGLGADAAIAGAFKTALVARGVIPHATTTAGTLPLPRHVVDGIRGILDELGLLA